LIKENVTFELIEKKSKFIANAFVVSSEMEAIKVLKETKKKYNDARHNVYAYVVIEEGQVISKCSDDGEPSGTAGSPILNMLNQKKLCNILVVVTRYFGGILLGTGGLLRAYTDSVKGALGNAEIEVKEKGYLIEMQISYSEIESLKYFCKTNNIKIKSEEFSEKVIIKLEVSKTKINKLENYDILEEIYL